MFKKIKKKVVRIRKVIDTMFKKNAVISVLLITLLLVVSNTSFSAIQTSTEPPPQQIFRILAVEFVAKLMGTDYPMKSAQNLIEGLLKSKNWDNSSTDYVSYIHLLSEYGPDQVLEGCQPYWVDYTTKANVEHEFETFLASASPNENIIFYYCGEGTQNKLLLDETITDIELNNWLGLAEESGAHVCIIIDSCRSGSMIADGLGGTLGSGRIVLCSSLSNQSSWNWGISAWSWFTGKEKTPYVLGGPKKPLGIIGANAGGANDTNGDGWISFMECFAFAQPSTQEYAALQGKEQDPVAYNGIGQDIPFVLIEPPLHDVAIKSITANTTVDPGTVYFNVTVENQGDYSETFDVTLSYDPYTAVIGEERITLESGELESIIFEWTLPSSDPKIYIIMAKASTVAGEVNTSNNFKILIFSIGISATIGGGSTRKVFK